MPTSTEVTSGAVSYAIFFLLVLCPFMNNFQLAVIGYSFVWLAILGVCVSASAGLIFRSQFRTASDAYFVCGGLLGLASIIFVFALNIPFDQQADQIQNSFNRMLLDLERSKSLGTFVQETWAQERTAKLQQLAQLKEFVTLIVSVFGGGVSGNLIVSAITEHRKTNTLHVSPFK